MTQVIINKTPHAVYILGDDRTILRVFPKSNGMIRVPEINEDIGFIEGVPISCTTWGKTSDVPGPQRGTYYIVSQLVRNALPDRPDLLVPKQVVRDENGNILGCKRLDIGSKRFKIN
jgi:hypothetical protein